MNNDGYCNKMQMKNKKNFSYDTYATNFAHIIQFRSVYVLFSYDPYATNFAHIIQFRSVHVLICSFLHCR